MIRPGARDDGGGATGADYCIYLRRVRSVRSGLRSHTTPTTHDKRNTDALHIWTWGWHFSYMTRQMTVNNFGCMAAKVPCSQARTHASIVRQDGRDGVEFLSAEEHAVTDRTRELVRGIVVQPRQLSATPCCKCRPLDIRET